MVNVCIKSGKLKKSEGKKENKKKKNKEKSIMYTTPHLRRNTFQRVNTKGNAVD